MEGMTLKKLQIAFPKTDRGGSRSVVWRRLDHVGVGCESGNSPKVGQAARREERFIVQGHRVWTSHCPFISFNSLFDVVLNPCVGLPVTLAPLEPSESSATNPWNSRPGDAIMLAANQIQERFVPGLVGVALCLALFVNIITKRNMCHDTGRSFRLPRSRACCEIIRRPFEHNQSPPGLALPCRHLRLPIDRLATDGHRQGGTFAVIK